MSVSVPVRSLILALALALCLLPAAPPAAAQKAEERLRAAGLVDIETTSPTIRLDIRYATPDNFTGQAVYPLAKCYLRRDVAERLDRVQKDLAGQGLGLKAFDCYRPFSIQERFWEIVPQEGYVARPVRKDGRPASGSKHNRGAAVDVTLVDASGRELPMPTGFDDFSEKAHRNYRGGDPAALANSRLLEEAMVRQGFAPLPTEWWHFDGPGWEGYELLDIPFN